MPSDELLHGGAWFESDEDFDKIVGFIEGLLVFGFSTFKTTLEQSFNKSRFKVLEVNDNFLLTLNGKNLELLGDDKIKKTKRNLLTTQKNNRRNKIFLSVIYFFCKTPRKSTPEKS